MQDGLGSEKLPLLQKERARKRAEKCGLKARKEGGKECDARSPEVGSVRKNVNKAAQASRPSEITMSWLLPIAFYFVSGNFHHGGAFPLLGSLS